MNFFQKHWKTIVVTVWILFSAVYILNSMWNNFQVNVMQNSYLAGQNDTITQVITKGSDKSCQPFNIYNQQGKIDLINVACLQKPNAGEVQPTAKK